MTIFFRSAKVSAAKFRLYSTTSNRPLAFAFDIDGVLKHGRFIIPEAKKALQKLDALNVPYIFITNGGGTMENERAKAISKDFQINLDESQMVLSHTVMKPLAQRLRDKNVLVVGGDEHGQKCREIAESYGFKNVYVPTDILCWNKFIYPFASPPAPHDGLPQSHTYRQKHVDFANVPFSAVMLFKDSANHGLDMQIICDLIRSKDGLIGTESDNGKQGVELHFSNPDLIWTTEYPQPRHGQGMFIEAIKMVHNIRSPDIDLQYKQYGKPYAVTYEYADNLLQQLIKKKSNSTENPMVVMVGDNPDSDIQGANNFGWQSALVRTDNVNNKAQATQARQPQDSPIDEKHCYLDEVSESQQLLKSLNLKTSSSAESSETVKIDTCKRWENDLLNNPKNKLAVETFSKGDITNTLSGRAARISDQNVFNLVASEIEDVTNQASSGRCWLFASTNLLRNEVKMQLNIEEFQLSQSYLSFWDRIEKSNQYLEHSIELSGEPIGSRIVDYINSSPIGDGGQFDMVVNLINKYGVVPQTIYPESHNSSNSGKINSLLTTKLREGGLELRKLSTSAKHLTSNPESVVRRRKNELLEEIYGAAVIAFGPPPSVDEEFVFEYKDKNNKVNSIKTTPLGFTDKYLNNFRVNDWYSLINDPRNEYSKLYTVDKLQNVVGGRPVLYVNTTADRLVDAVVTHLKNGKPVFFGCDVGKFSERNGGLLDPKLFDYELAFNLKLGMNKADRLATGESSMTHAMSINAAHIVDGKVQRFRIENSWGKDAGQHGYYICTVDWFKEFVYQVVVNKSLAPKDLNAVFENKDDVHVLPCYDPMGALAYC
ncbi:hypothetical protein E3P78_00427 [Wallemia ichthyophaga]|nr:hypothetical protein E3P78_00427 [Wallemia ichthyophaga]